VVHLARQPQSPLGHGVVGRAAVAEDRPLVGQHLAGGQPVRVGDHPRILHAIATEDSHYVYLSRPGRVYSVRSAAGRTVRSSFRNWSKASTTPSLTPYTLLTRSMPPPTSPPEIRSVSTSNHAASNPLAVLHQ